MEGYYMDNIYFSDQESEIMQKLLAFVTVHRGEILSDDEIEAFQKMLELHQKPIRYTLSPFFSYKRLNCSS